MVGVAFGSRVRRFLAVVLGVSLVVLAGGQMPAAAANVLPPGAVGVTPPGGNWWADEAYDDGFSGNGRWANPDQAFYYRDAGGRLVVLTHVHVMDGLTLTLHTFDPVTFARVSTRRVSIADFPEFGGFLAGADGNLYVALGRRNLEESATRTVVVVRKYSRSWQLLGEARIPGGVSQGHPGISEPFVGGVGRMALCGTTLVLHMARQLFRSADGLRHQMNLTVSVDTASMTARSFQDAYGTYSYASHSFNQLVACRGGDLVLADHGDAYPRAIVAGVMRGFPPAGSARMDQRILWQLPGRTGDNYTGTRLTGLGLTGTSYLAVGSSVPHRNPVRGLTGSQDSLPRNVYLIRAPLGPGPPTFTWLTTITDASSDASEPRLVRLGEDRFAVLFTITTGQGTSPKRTMHYRLVDAAGTVLAAKSWPGRVFHPGSDPIRISSRLIWAQRAQNTQVGYLYTLDVANPSNPRLSMTPAAVKARAVDAKSKLLVDVDPDKGSGYWTFQVHKKVGTSWKPGNTYRTLGTRETRTIDLPRGTYRVVVKAKYGYLATTSTTVTLTR